MHEEEAIREENETLYIGLVDPPADENLVDETLGDKNQPGNTIFSKSPQDEAYPEENLENDNFSGDTIVLGSPERKNHVEEELEGEPPLGDIVPIETLPNADTMPPENEPEENATTPPPTGSPRIKKSYKNMLRKMLKIYRNRSE